MEFSYECTSSINTSSTVIEEEENVFEAIVENSKGVEDTISVSVFGNYKPIKNNLKTNEYLNSTQVKIVVNSHYKYFKTTIDDEYGFYNETISGNNILLEDLYDGIFEVTIECNDDGKVSGNMFTCVTTFIHFSFGIDHTKPTITGASLNMTGLYVNNSFEVLGEDSGSGVEGIYMLEPSGSDYIKLSDNNKIIKYESGLYCFYALDKAGNMSKMYYVNYDINNPNGYIYNTNNIIIEQEYYNQDFYYKGKDSNSGVYFTEYKTPNSLDWEVYYNNKITKTSEEGLYQFRTIDKSYNKSEIKTITFDYTKPYGIFLDENGKEIKSKNINNKYFKFQGKDELSGISKIIMKFNDETEIEYCNNIKLFENGTYTFVCYDNAGNISDEYIINLDNICPQLICDDVNFFSKTINGFMVVCSDENSCSLYYKRPLDEQYSLCENEFKIIQNEDTKGKYQFYAIDSFNNKSDIFWIELIGDSCSIKINTKKDSNKISIDWDDESSVYVNNKKYTKNDIIDKEGTYNIKVVDTYGQVYNFEYTISCFYVFSEVIEPNCQEDGYTIYKCISCNSTVKTNYTHDGVHIYDKYYKEPTCTEEGGIYYECIICGTNYMEDIVPPLGHSYDIMVNESTCERYGIRIYSCERCGYSYDEFIAKKEHDLTKIDEYSDKDNNYYVYICEYCGYSEIEIIPKNYNNISNVLISIIDKYIPYVIRTYLLTISIWSIIIGTRIIILHKNEEREKTKKMLKNYFIGTIIIFILIVLCPYLIKVIASIL